MSASDKPTSLELLLPDQAYNIKAPPTEATPSDASPSTDSQSSSNIDDSIVAAKLIRLCLTFDDAMRNGPSDVVHRLGDKYVHPEFTARLDTAYISSWQVYCTIMDRWIASNPGYHNTIRAATADISDDGRDATVYLLMEAVGWPVELKRMVVSVLKWKLRRRKWALYENITMRGCDTFDIGVG